MILSVSVGLPVEKLAPWAASARKHYAGRIVLLCDTPQQYAPLEDAYNVELVSAKIAVEHGTCDLCRTRWNAIGDFLDGVDGPVLVTDARDVVFQANPMSTVGDKLLIGSEHKPHHVCAWSMHWLSQVAPDQVDALSSAPVLCAGVIGGPAPLVRKLAQHLYMLTPEIHCPCTGGAAHMCDQAVLNVLARNGMQPDLEIPDGWVFHARGWLWDAAIIGGEVRRVGPLFGNLFPIVHQWDVAPELQHFAEIR